MAKKKSKNTGLIVTLLVASLAGGALIGAYVVKAPNVQPLGRPLPDVTASRIVQTGTKVIPRSDIDGNTKFAYQKIDIPAGNDPRVYLVNEYLRQLHEKGLGDNSARAIGIDVRDRIAYLSFNRAFEETYGTFDEATVINGILTTLGQFDGIAKVVFEIDGKPMDTLGNVDLTEAQMVKRPTGREEEQPKPDVP
jgi:hypothetical protein